MEHTLDFIPPKFAKQSEVEKSKKSFEEYETSRSKIIELLSKLDNKSATNEVNGRITSRISLVGEKLDTVQIDFIDTEGWLSEFESDKNIAYSVVLSPRDLNYLSGDPLVRAVYCESEQTNISEVNFDTGTLSPHLGSSTPRSAYIKDETDLSAAIGFISEIFEEKIKKIE